MTGRVSGTAPQLAAVSCSSRRSVDASPTKPCGAKGMQAAAQRMFSGAAGQGQRGAAPPHHRAASCSCRPAITPLSAPNTVPAARTTNEATTAATSAELTASRVLGRAAHGDRHEWLVDGRMCFWVCKVWTRMQRIATSGGCTELAHRRSTGCQRPPQTRHLQPNPAAPSAAPRFRLPLQCLQGSVNTGCRWGAALAQANPLQGGGKHAKQQPTAGSHVHATSRA